MKGIFQIYGRLMIAVIIGVALIGVFLNVKYQDKKGLHQIAGEMMNQQAGKGLQSNHVTNGYKEYYEAKVVAFSFLSDPPITSGGEVCLDKHFEVVTSDHSEVGFEVLWLGTEDGSGITYTKKEEGCCAVFPEPGIYKLRVKTAPEHLKQKEFEICFPVEKGESGG